MIGEGSNSAECVQLKKSEKAPANRGEGNKYNCKNTGEEHNGESLNFGQFSA